MCINENAPFRFNTSTLSTLIRVRLLNAIYPEQTVFSSSLGLDAEVLRRSLIKLLYLSHVGSSFFFLKHGGSWRRLWTNLDKDLKDGRHLLT